MSSASLNLSAGTSGLLKRVSRGFLLLSVGDIAAKGFAFLITVLLARRLSDVGFGKLSTAISIVSYLALVVDMGLSVYGARAIAQSRARAANLLINITGLRLALSLVVLCGLWFTMKVTNLPQDLEWVLLASSLWLLPYALNIEWVFQGLERVGLAGLCRLLGQMAVCGLIVLLVHNPSHIQMAALIRPGGEIVVRGVLFGGVVFYLLSQRTDLRLHLGTWKNLLHQSWPLAISSLFTSVYAGNIDFVLLNLWRGAQQVGWYAAAYRVYLLLPQVLNLMVYAFYPVLSKSWKEPSRFRQFHQQFMIVMLILSLPLSLFPFLLADDLIFLLYGSDYLNAVGALKVLSLAPIFTGISATFAVSLIAAGFSKDAMAVYGVGLVVNLLSNVVLIPAYGLIGASIATVLAEGAVLAAGFIWFRRKIYQVGLPIPVFGKLFLSGSATGIIMIFARSQQWLNSNSPVWRITGVGILGVCVYLFLILVLKVWSLSDWKVMG